MLSFTDRTTVKIHAETLRFLASIIGRTSDHRHAMLIDASGHVVAFNGSSMLAIATLRPFGAAGLPDGSTGAPTVACIEGDDVIAWATIAATRKADAIDVAWGSGETIATIAGAQHRANHVRREHHSALRAWRQCLGKPASRKGVPVMASPLMMAAFTGLSRLAAEHDAQRVALVRRVMADTSRQYADRIKRATDPGLKRKLADDRRAELKKHRESATRDAVCEVAIHHGDALDPLILASGIGDVTWRVVISPMRADPIASHPAEPLAVAV